MSDTVPNPGAGAAALDDDRLKSALQEANLPTLLLVLTQLTGDDRWLNEPYRPRRGRPLDDNDSGGLPVEIQEEVRRAALQAIVDHRAGRLTPIELTPDRIAEMLEIALVEEVPREYGPLLAEEMGVLSRDVEVPTPPEGFRVLIIGAGMSGLCAAVKLRQAGVDFTVLEKDSEVGGTWWENTYPGCGVDTPSHLYSFAFAPNTQWSRYFAKRDEVFSYLGRIADEFGVRDAIRFRTEVIRADYDTAAALWRVEIRDPDGRTQTLTANVLISAVGMVNRPSVPPIPGLDSFAGPVMHTAEWRPEADLAGKRVAVIGTGASAMQAVPSIVDDAERVLIFQRSKQWAIPHPNYHRSVSDNVRCLIEHVPFYGAWYRLRNFWNFSDRLHPTLQIDPAWPHQERSINAANDRHRVFLTDYITEQLAERPDLLDACLPDYPPYGKRPLLDNGWFKTVCRDDVELITDAVAEVRPGSVVSASGTEYEADVIVLATGFKTLQFLWPMEIRGRSGATLREQWGEEDARAYLGVTVPDFPNFFILNGPNTNAGHGGSAVIATEFQMRYIMGAIGHLLSGDVGSAEVRSDVFWDYNKELDDAMSRCIWVHPGMTTYYRNGAGRVVVSSPWKYIDYWQRTLTFEPNDYVDAAVEAGTETAK
ncbi:flavin-containing monooxygenase [Nocardia miyunensis]|uniref:flavin-containing monooxygenase n=1 Tax=Nocardia miyunensis TaxID=282684 RepID=UPI000835B0C1|nr:NAD(P)/FAD-dependent oxidoreductase [Nocardia miyunensis]